MSRIFPCLLESFMSRICPVLFVQNLSRIFSYPEYVRKKFLEFFMSRIYPVYLSRFCPDFFHVWNMSRIFFHVWFFGHEKFQTANFDHFSGHFPDIFWT